MNVRRGFAAALLLALLFGSAPAVAQDNQAPAGPPAGQTSGMELVTLPNPDSPLVSVRLLFDAGSIHDPEGKEGLASLTALMVSQASTQKRSYTDLLEALYPLAASIDSNTDREVTIFSGEVHRDSLNAYTTLFAEALLQPAFSADDFKRNRDLLESYLTNTLRSNDELLGLEMIQEKIFQGHPYEHHPAGTVEGLKNITLDDVKRFYKERYTQANLMLGLAGGYSNDYAAKLQKDIAAALPKGQKGRPGLPEPRKAAGRTFTLIEKETGSVGVSFGFPLPVTRADADYYPLMVAASYLGEHRSSHGRLFQELREKRGLNYGNYAYIEHYFAPPQTNNPTPNVPRRDQYFSVWIRPVVPADAQFALRAGLYEVQRLHDKGLTKEEFELARDFLVNYSKLWAQSQETRLGIHMDSKRYGMPYWIDEIESRLKKLTVEDVNRAVKKYLHPDNYEAVIVTANAAQLKDTLQKDEPSPKKYNSEVAPDVLEADKTITTLKVRPTAIEIVPIGQVFQK